MWPTTSTASPKSRLEDNPLFRRLLIVVLLLETGLLLMLIPWSAFWDRNYFGEVVPAIEPLLTSNYVRGAVTGLGLVNIWAALWEAVDIFRTRAADNRNR